MSAESDPRVEEMLTTVIRLGEGERAHWLDDNCPDPSLRSIVEAELETRVARDLDEDVTIATDPGVVADGIGVGARIGPCVLVRLIGEGGMGAVYEARQEGLGRPVAVKLMKSGLVTQQARQRFAYEARLLAGLRHPGIAQVFEYGTHEAPGGVVVPYFVMELVPAARTVTRHCVETKVESDEAVELFARICDAVHYAHQHGVVHRDLKPANILVDEDSAPKVIDFGLARDVEDDAVTRSFQTESGALVGTLPYMSPEQLSGKAAAVDTRSDVYSLGVILYELVCGRRPFDVRDLSLPEVVALVRDHPPPPPPASVDRDLARILAKALHKEPERRYSSADALGEDVRRFLRGLPVEARSSTLTYNLRLFARRNRALVAAAALVFIAAIAAAIVSTVFALDAEEARRRETERADAAEALLSSSNDLSEWVMLDFVPKLRNLPGSIKLSEESTERVLAHLDEIADVADDDPRHLNMTGLAYLQVGLIQGSPSFPNLGRTDDALVSIDRACERFERLLRIREGDIEASINLGLAHSARGEILLDVGRTEEGLETIGEWQSKLRACLEAAPENVRLLRVLVNNHHLLCEVWRRRGDWSAAEAELLEAVEIHELAFTLRGDDVSEHRELGGTLLALADVAAFAERPADAKRYAERGIAELELAYPDESSRNAVDGMADRALARRVLADALVGLEDIEGARAEFERSLAMRESIVAAHPEEVLGLLGLGEVLQRLADIRLGPEDDPKGALPLYRRQYEVFTRIRSLAPRNTDYRLRLQMATSRYGQVLLMNEQTAEAAPVVKEQLVLAEELVAENGGDPRFARARAEALTLCAHHAIGRLTDEGADDEALVEEALELYDQAVEIYEDLEERGVILPGMRDVKRGVESQIRIAERHLEMLGSNDDD